MATIVLSLKKYSKRNLQIFKRICRLVYYKKALVNSGLKLVNSGVL
jgi:hypothetical protein